MVGESMPDELTVYEAMTLFDSGVFRESACSKASEAELAEDAASFAALDALSDGRGYQSIEVIAETVRKLSKG